MPVTCPKGPVTSYLRGSTQAAAAAAAAHTLCATPAPALCPDVTQPTNTAHKPPASESCHTRRARASHAAF
jgi:hypothetical protein